MVALYNAMQRAGMTDEEADDIILEVSTPYRLNAECGGGQSLEAALGPPVARSPTLSA